jgi:hypothetical protein
MPQLDTATFLPQVFWLLIVFWVFYLIVKNNIVPALSTMIKVRSKKLNLGSGNVGEMQGETGKISVTYDALIVKSLPESGNCLQSTTLEAGKWISKSLELQNQSFMKKTTKKDTGVILSGFYLKTVGSISAKKNQLLTFIA